MIKCIEFATYVCENGYELTYQDIDKDGRVWTNYEDETNNLDFKDNNNRYTIVEIYNEFENLNDEIDDSLTQLVNITLKLRNAEQAHFLEIYLRDKMFPNQVVDFINLPDTKELYENDPIFKKLVKNVKDAQRVKNEYVNKMN